MKKLFTILRNKFTPINLLVIVATFLFAVLLRHIFLHFLEYPPVRGKLEVLDIGFFTIVVLFKIIFSAFMEYLLDDKFSVPFKQSTVFNMENSNSENTSEGSSKGTQIISDEEREKTRIMIEKAIKNLSKESQASIESNNRFIEESVNTLEKMQNVLLEQEKKIFELYRIKQLNDVKIFEENGNLYITAPGNMSDSEANKVSKQIDSIDRSLQNKFSEYKNLMSKDGRLYGSEWSDVNKPVWEVNQKLYKELFDKED